MAMRRTWLALAVALLAAAPACRVGAETIGQIKRYLDWTPVTTAGVVTSLGSFECYIESPDRSSGIWVISNTTGVRIGDIVSVIGTISTEDGERVIEQAVLFPSGGPLPLRPLGMSNKWVGGSWFGYQDCAWDAKLVAKYGTQPQWWWYPASGLNNTGLLITSFGTVTAAYSAIGGSRWFYMDDGYGATGDLGDRGILVYSNAEVREGDHVVVTGISSVECAVDDGWRVIRVIRPRSESDVQVTAADDPWDPCFSEEFDKPYLDMRWARNPGVGQVSVRSNPGWLRMVMPEFPGLLLGSGGPWVGRMICPSAVQVDLRIKAEFSPYSQATQKVYLLASPPPDKWPPSYQDLKCLATITKDPVNGTHVLLGSYADISMTDDTCYFRIYECDANSWRILVSFDGVTYYPNKSAYAVRPWSLCIWMTSENGSPTGQPFAVCCDYVRVVTK